MAVGAGVLLVLAVGVLVLTGTFSGGGQPPPGAAQPSNDVAAQGGAAAEQPRPRGEVTVAVLNGTTSAGLAAGTAAEVARAGFRQGAVDDNDVQNLSATTIEYAQGYRASAREVAQVVGVGADAIAQLDRNTQVLAGEQANVVIIVGADGTQAAEGTG
ncbi:MAG TPA: LytR C-terminal domain-containing protein [Solirubrobacteraceae bacterium]|nr:LytR C-terminal domain-containing protein [Solirubrobacteraceae bacterium]